ncbi:hypothetical protein [Thermoactinospora rubra]|uniref:hypothetical protein n=1 Tax=Thermoactinospora rubra TaxID=1088767 RepID=UPI000A10472D|nr:hypothetical protein [Thermoactinospora rubra]
MTERTYEPGEIVDIHIEDARVVECKGGSLAFEYAVIRSEGGVNARSQVQHDADNVRITRLLPAIAPKNGELWRDATGRHWLAAAVDDPTSTFHGQVRLFRPGCGAAGVAVSHVHQHDGPLTPVYRDGES